MLKIKKNLVRDKRIFQNVAGLKNVYTDLVRIPERKSTHGRSMCIGENTVKLILIENVMVWITFSWFRIGTNEGAITKAVMKIRVS